MLLLLSFFIFIFNRYRSLDSMWLFIGGFNPFHYHFTADGKHPRHQININSVYNPVVLLRVLNI